MSTDRVPGFYKFFFLYFDPVCSAWGAYMDLFTPATVMTAYNPTAIHTRTQDILFQQLAGPLLMLVFLDIFLLRYTKDLYVWKVYQFSIVLFDVCMLYSFYDALELQGRVSPSLWQPADWVNIGITGAAGVTRLAFVAEFGFHKDQAKQAKMV